jgi:hypothetical protein
VNRSPFALLTAALFLPAAAWAQSGTSVKQTGTVTPGHVLNWETNGVARDGGPAADGKTKEIGITNKGLPFCINDAPISSPTGYHRLCWGHSTTGDAVLSIDALGGATAGSFLLRLNGAEYTMPQSAAVVGSDVAVPRNSVLKTVQGAIGQRAVRLGFADPGDGGLATYNWSADDCATADDGAQVQPTVTGCWLADFSDTMPTPMIWGAKGDGVASDSTPVQAALTARAGSTLYQGNHSYYLGTSITVPISTTFRGPTTKIAMVGTINVNDTAFADYPGIRLSSAATINLLASSALDGLMIYRSGMVFPVTNPTTFAGTAITALDNNIALRNGIVMGFAQAFTAYGVHRGTIADMAFDNQANIYINNSADTWQISHIHAWPFSVVGSGGDPNVVLSRTGANFYLGNSNEHTMVSHYLSFGYQKGFVFDNVQAATCTDCDADGVTTLGDGLHNGFEIIGNLYGNVTLLGPRAYAQHIGILREDSSGGGVWNAVKIIGATLAANNTALHLDNTTGLTLLTDSEITQYVNPIEIFNPYAILDMNNNVIYNNTGDYVINAASETDNVIIGPSNRFGFPGTTSIPVTNGSVVVHQVTASGATLTLPHYGSIFEVSDGGTVTDIAAPWPGRQVTLLFAGVTTIQPAAAGAPATRVQLKGNVPFVSYAGATLTLTNPGNSAWVEVARQ